MAFSRYQQPEKYMMFSTFPDMQNAAKYRSTQTPRNYLSEYNLFSLNGKDCPKTVVSQKVGPTGSLTRYFSQTVFPNRSPKRHKDLAFSTFPVLQNNIKYQTTRDSHLFRDEKFFALGLTKSRANGLDTRGTIQLRAQIPDFPLSRHSVQALFHHKSPKRQREELHNYDSQSSSDEPNKKHCKLNSELQFLDDEQQQAKTELSNPQTSSGLKVRFEGCNCKNPRIVSKKFRVGCKGRRTYVSHRCDICKKEWSSCPNECGSMCEWKNLSFLQCKTCFLKLKQKVIPWPWPYQWVRCPGCNARYIYDKGDKYPREPSSCKLLNGNPQAWVPKQNDKITSAPNLLEDKLKASKLPGKTSPTEQLTSSSTPSSPDEFPDKSNSVEATLQIEVQTEQMFEHRIDILADVAINFSMLVDTAAQSAPSTKGSPTKPFDMENNDHSDEAPRNASYRAASVSSSAGSRSPPDSADSGSESGEAFPGSNEDASGPEKAPARLDEDKVPMINNTEPTGSTESVQPALWLQNKYESTDNDSGAKPSLEKIRLGQIKRGLPTRATARVKRLVQRECARLLWKFFTQALASDRMNVDHTLRMVLHLSLSFEDCRPFAREPGPGNSTAHRQWDHKRGPQWRLAQIKKGSKLPELTANASHSSLAEDKRNIKTECGRLIWYVIHEAEAQSVVNPQEVLELRHMVVGLRNKTRAPTWGKLDLGEHLVELQVDDPIKARRTSTSSDVPEHARITHVHQDATSGVRTYSLLFSDGNTRERVSRKEIQTIPLNIGNSVLVKPKKAQDWERARIKAVHTDKMSGVKKYDVETDVTKTLVTHVSVQDLRIRDRRLQVRRNAHERNINKSPDEKAPADPLTEGYVQSSSSYGGVKIDVVLRVPHGGRAPI